MYEVIHRDLQKIRYDFIQWPERLTTNPTMNTKQLTGREKCHRKSYQPAHKRLKKNSLPDYTSKPATSTSFRITPTIIWTGGNVSVTSSTLITTCSTCLWRAGRPQFHFMCGIDAYDQFTITFNPWQYADVSPKAYSWAPHQHVEMVRTDKTWIYSTPGQTHIIEQWAQSTMLWSNSDQSAYKKTAAKFSSSYTAKPATSKSSKTTLSIIWTRLYTTTIAVYTLDLELIFNFRAIDLDLIITLVKSRGTSIPMSCDQFTMS